MSERDPSGELSPPEESSRLSGEGVEPPAPPPSIPASQPQAGWYLDPQSSSHQRYWDGSSWSEQVMPLPPSAPQGSQQGSTVTLSDGTQVERAGWWSRVGASIIDAIILGAIAGAIFVLLGAAGAYDFDSLDAAATPDWSEFDAWSTLVSLALSCLYAPLLYQRAGAHGQTFGKQALGIRVISQNGSRIEGGTGFLREPVVKGLLFGYASAILLFIPTLLNYLWPLWDDQNQALHDKICSTLVVKAR